MKWIKKNLFVFISVILMIIIAVYTINVSMKKARNYEIYSKPKIETKVYSVWHVETFEGGGKARIGYLNTIAREIERENPGTLFVVRQVEAENLASELESNSPDIISFGYGVGKLLVSRLTPYERTYDVRDKLIESCYFNHELLAIPYIASGYAMITNGQTTNDFHCGTTAYTHPEQIYRNMNLNPQTNETQYEAYKYFVNHSSATLLGTARDVFRVNSLKDIGRANSLISPIDSYTDLIQYLGIFTRDHISEQFVSLALSKKYQSTLRNYSLFSTLHGKIYSTGIYTDMEDAIVRCSVAKLFDN